MSVVADRTERGIEVRCPPVLVLPALWGKVGPHGRWGAKYMKAGPAALLVLRSAGRERDGRDWLHVSVSGRLYGSPTETRLPSWAELVEVKEIFLGVEALALQVLPPRSQWVNVHDHVLHLWHPLEGAPPVPDFRHAGAI